MLKYHEVWRINKTKQISNISINLCITLGERGKQTCHISAIARIFIAQRNYANFLCLSVKTNISIFSTQTFQVDGTEHLEFAYKMTVRVLYSRAVKMKLLLITAVFASCSGLPDNLCRTSPKISQKFFQVPMPPSSQSVH